MIEGTSGSEGRGNAATRLARQRIIAALAAGATAGQAAAQLGIARSTVYRALREPDVRAALDQIHAARMQVILDASMDLAPGALDTLRLVMSSPVVPPAARVAAARAALAAMASVVPLADTERRIAALEAQLSE